MFMKDTSEVEILFFMKDASNTLVALDPSYIRYAYVCQGHIRC